MKHLLMSIAAFISMSHAQEPTNTPYGNDKLHQWALDVVYEAWPEDKSGGYDLCYSRADIETHSFIPNDNIGFTDNEGMVQNACAIILNGAEY